MARAMAEAKGCTVWHAPRLEFSAVDFGLSNISAYQSRAKQSLIVCVIGTSLS